ncbi:MAG: nicotinamide riboside transporter PnuC [Bacteroidetes bacterium]|nr:nicotinamide riboside transporter PnuC [Bacteroidota bacterium]MCL1968164.1 nicotinamide riboside transporter PnuC [Bacteroidota bacterium]
MTISTIEILGAAIGLVYVILEYRASWWLWIAGIVMSLFYIYIFAKVNCYAWALTYLYYLGANIYGIIVWKRNSDENPNLGIAHLPKKYYQILLIITLLSTLILFFILKRYTDTLIPVSEAFSTALSIVGMWLLAKKYLQHWYVWMVVNAIYAIANLWLGLYFSALLFAVYFVVSIMGLVRWRKLISHHTKGITPLA